MTRLYLLIAPFWENGPGCIDAEALPAAFWLAYGLFRLLGLELPADVAADALASAGALCRNLLPSAGD